ncbi:MAG: transcription termination/antitermination NusG family protein [Candidatus Acidiferrum sp.]
MFDCANHPIAYRSENSEALPIDNVCCKTRSAWYAIHSYPRHEKRVHDRLKYAGIECYLPLYESMHRWRNGRTMPVELPLFPCYLFATFDFRDRVGVLSLPGVISLVGAGANPWPLPTGEIETLREGLHLRNARPHSYLAAGQKVRIKSSPLAGLAGILVRWNSDLRVVLSVDMLMQSVSVEVGADDIVSMDGR